MSDMQNQLSGFLNKYLKIKTDVLIIFLIALILRLIFLSVSLNQLTPDELMTATNDSKTYLGMTGDLLNGTNNFEHGFFIFGPAYAYTLAIFFTVFGKGLFPYILVQIILSSLSCVLIFKLANHLLKSHPVAFMAGIIAAVSYTAITLSMVLLTDTLFFFLFIWSLYLFLKGFETGRGWCFYSSGIILGAAILYRSVAQFWPLALILITFYLYKTKKRARGSSPEKARKASYKALIGIALAVLFVSVWVIRNIAAYDLPIVAGASANGIVRLVNLFIDTNFDRPANELWTEWQEEYMATHELETLSLSDGYRFHNATALNLFKEYPWKFTKAYVSLAWENTNAICFYHRILFPDISGTTIKWEYKYANSRLSYITVILVTIGFIVLAVRRQYEALAILFIIYIYFVLLMGFGRWQGSRYNFPTQISWSIVISYLMFTAYHGIFSLYNKLKEASSHVPSSSSESDEEK